MKRALVFSGGGSRGAYEIGAWQALNELGVRFRGVYGTSIGAINAGLMAQGDPDRAMRLWENINLRQVLNTEDENLSIERLIHRKRDVIPFLMEHSKNLRLDISPLEALMREHLSEGRVRASGLELGVMTVRVPQMQPVAVRLRDMAEGSLTDWLLASASCFPIFPTRKIDGERYVDGGYYDNLPIDMAIEDDMDEIIAVSVHPAPPHPEYSRAPFVKMIHPLHELGGFLDFNPRLIQRGRLLGYHDALKAFGRMDGIRYTFRYQSELSLAEAARRYAKRVAQFDAAAIERTMLKPSQSAYAPLMSALGRETPLNTLTRKEMLLRGVELGAELMGFREDAIYDAGDLSRRIDAFAMKGGAVHSLTERMLQEAESLGKRETLSLVCRAVRSRETLPPEWIPLLARVPEAVAYALTAAPSV